MTPTERELLVAVADWIDKTHYLPGEVDPSGPAPKWETTRVHHALENLLDEIRLKSLAERPKNAK